MTRRYRPFRSAEVPATVSFDDVHRAFAAIGLDVAAMPIRKVVFADDQRHIEVTVVLVGEDGELSTVGTKFVTAKFSIEVVSPEELATRRTPP